VTDTTSNFSFLRTEYPILYNVGRSAELHLYSDPVTTLFKLRQFEERMLDLVFKEHLLAFPRENTVHNKIKTLDFEGVLPLSVRDLLNTIKEKGNIAVHQGKGTTEEALQTLRSTFKVAKWFFETYSPSIIDLTVVKFINPVKIDTEGPLRELEKQYKELEARFNSLLNERETKSLSSEKQQEIQRRSTVAATKIELTEAETRELIDEQLRLAGWEVDTKTINYKLHKTKPARGKSVAISEWWVAGKWADYALFIDRKLYGIVEAKKYAQDISTDLRQSKIYAELAEEEHKAELLGKWEKYKVPFLFSTNGRPYIEQIKTKSGIWFLDVRNKINVSQPLRGWYSPDGLKKLFEKDIDAANKELQAADHDFLTGKKGLNLRTYQVQAIKAVEKKIIEQPNDRRALIAMATGTGKTRTIIGLCYQLIKTNRFNRILFLVDRTLLGQQAIDAFKDNKIVALNTFSEIYEVKGLKDAVPDADTRLHFATVQGMVKRLFYNDKKESLPSVDQFDCIIIDEAHRGYLLDREMDQEDLVFKNQQDYISKYKQVLDYFDAFAIGLTATPALHTKEIFGHAVYTYSYIEAVIDGYLVDHDPPFIIKTKLSEEGIKWEKGEKPKVYNKETNSIVELEELEDELHIDVSGFNKLVLTDKFNRTVVKELVKHLDPEGNEKTLIFAATDEHADFVVLLLKEEFREIGIYVPDDAIQKITGGSYDPQDLLKRFKNEKFPNIAVTVDLLTTGIDVPAICNLVFLRRVKSRILYEQMLGRATRRCDDITKETFKIFDAVRIYEVLEDYTQMKPVVVNPATTFIQLADELQHIRSNERAKKQLEQIIAKLQRKKRIMQEEDISRFTFDTGGFDPDQLIRMLKTQPVQDSVKQVRKFVTLWNMLDELKPAPPVMYVSEHEDEHIGTERGYGKGSKPEDYLQSFSEFIRNNQNKISALNIVCTRPQDLDRKSLKELKMVLDQQGFTEKALKSAWKDTKNEDIAADIVSYIRTLAVGNALLSHEERIKNAVNKVLKMKQWNAVQLRWLVRIEKQLLAETVLTMEDLDEEPFRDAGGFTKLDKIFENQLTYIVNTINDHLYTQTA
jgi:type I restriction enzyme R subunit